MCSQDHGFVLPSLLQSPAALPEADQPCGLAFFTLTFQMGSDSERGVGKLQLMLYQYKKVKMC